jgi:hypothetical protein
MADHYAEAFKVLSGHCFRMVTDPEPLRRGQPTHCAELVRWRGRFRTRGERVYRVDACEGHGDELTHRTNIMSKSPGSQGGGTRAVRPAREPPLPE